MCFVAVGVGACVCYIYVMNTFNSTLIIVYYAYHYTLIHKINGSNEHRYYIFVTTVKHIPVDEHDRYVHVQYMGETHNEPQPSPFPC